MKKTFRILNRISSARPWGPGPIVVAAVLACARVGSADVPVKVIRFDDVKPPGVVINSTFEAIGFDPQERVYATLCNSNPTNGDCHLFRYDPKSGKREYLGSLNQAAKRDGNLGPNAHWPKKEVIIKGHTHNWFLDGRIWLGTMNEHGYETPATHRGVHIFGYDLASGVLTDHAQWQPKGVFREHSGMYALTTYPEKNLLIGISAVHCEIILYNPSTRQTQVVAGVPPTNNPQLAGRDTVVLAGGKLLYQCGSANTPFGIYDLHTGVNKVSRFKASSVLTLGYAPTFDRKQAYIADLKNLYVYDLARDEGKVLTTLDPAGLVRQTSAPALSLDEKKLYYVINQTEGDGGAYVDDLYEYNLQTRVRAKLMNLKSLVDGGAKLSGAHATASSGKIYFVFNANKVGIVEVDVSARTGPRPRPCDHPPCGPGSDAGPPAADAGLAMDAAAIRDAGAAPDATSAQRDRGAALADSAGTARDAGAADIQSSPVADIDLPPAGGDEEPVNHSSGGCDHLPLARRSSFTGALALLIALLFARMRRRREL